MTRLKVESKKALGSTFADLEITDEIVTPTNPKFPTILALELPNTEQGNTLENVDIGALMYGVQIEVTDNKKQANAKRVMNKVVKIMNFGAFVELWTGYEGLVHISKLDEKRVEKVEDVVNVDDEIIVKVMGFDDKGKIILSRKDALKQE